MGCDTVVALGRATCDGQTRFGQGSDEPARHCRAPCLVSGHTFAPDEKVRTQSLELPQARQTCAVLACQPPGGWGYEYGVNEHQVALSYVGLRAALRPRRPGLLGPDLVRLALERGRTARQAVDVITTLVSRYGQGAFPGCPAEAEHDNAFLIADPTEAYAIEAAGTYWVYQEIREIRVMSNVRIVRQDWDRISPGLAAHAIAQGWWPEDGSKLDFSGALGETPRDHGEALRRWGNTTLLLVEQSGRIETTFLRHVLNRLPEEPRSAADSPKPTRGTLNRLAAAALRPVVCRNANFIVQMNVDGTRLAVTWWTIGSPWCNIQFPLFLDGELPHALASVNTEPDSDNIWKRLQLLGEQVCRDAELLAHARDRFSRLQARFDQEAEEFAAEGATLKRRLSISEFRRQVGFFMQHNLERLDELLTEALGSQSFAVVGS